MRETTLYQSKNEGAIALVVICFIIPLLWPFLPYALNTATEFLLTDRRIRIKKVTGAWIELPMDSVGTIVRTFWWGRLIIKTASGAIAVWGFQDRDKVFELISKRMITRQEEAAGTAAQALPEL